METAPGLASGCAPKGTALIVGAVVLIALSQAAMFTPLLHYSGQFGTLGPVEARIFLWQQCFTIERGDSFCESTVSSEYIHSECVVRTALFMFARAAYVATLGLSLCAVLPLGIMDWCGRPACCFHRRRRLVSIVTAGGLVVTTTMAWVIFIVLWQFGGPCGDSFQSIGWTWGPFAPLMICSTVFSACLLVFLICCTRERLTISLVRHRLRNTWRPLPLAPRTMALLVTNTLGLLFAVLALCLPVFVWGTAQEPSASAVKVGAFKTCFYARSVSVPVPSGTSSPTAAPSSFSGNSMSCVSTNDWFKYARGHPTCDVMGKVLGVQFGVGATVAAFAVSFFFVAVDLLNPSPCFPSRARGWTLLGIFIFVAPVSVVSWAVTIVLSTLNCEESGGQVIASQPGWRFGPMLYMALCASVATWASAGVAIGLRAPADWAPDVVDAVPVEEELHAVPAVAAEEEFPADATQYPVVAALRTGRTRHNATALPHPRTATAPNAAVSAPSAQRYTTAVAEELSSTLPHRGSAPAPDPSRSNFYHYYPAAHASATTTTSTPPPPPPPPRFATVGGHTDDDVIPVSAGYDERHLHSDPRPVASSNGFRDTTASGDDDDVVVGVPVYPTTDAPTSAAPSDFPPPHDVMSPTEQ